MPELPEVETVVRDLRPLLIGRTIVDVLTGRKTLRRAWTPKVARTLIGRQLVGVGRRGKWILVDAGEPWLLVHLGMTGQFTVVDSSVPRETHTHAVFTLDNGAELRFRDIRRFGSLSLFPSRDALEESLRANKLGPEPFDIAAENFFEGLKKTARNLKACLLDQRLIAGVGNIYADEALHEAALHPALLGKRLSREQAERLRLAIVSVLTRGIEKRGSTIRNYVGGSGLMGKMQDEFRVYGRSGEPCLSCNTPITRIVLAGRSTHFCQKCQAKRR